MHNRDQLMPLKEQLERAEATAHRYQEEQKGNMKIYYVVPDYFEERPKACMNGWGNVFLTITLMVLRCLVMRHVICPVWNYNVRDLSIREIWKTPMTSTASAASTG